MKCKQPHQRFELTWLIPFSTMINIAKHIDLHVWLFVCVCVYIHTISFCFESSIIIFSCCIMTFQSMCHVTNITVTHFFLIFMCMSHICFSCYFVLWGFFFLQFWVLSLMHDEEISFYTLNKIEKSFLKTAIWQSGKTTYKIFFLSLKPKLWS